MSRGATRPGLKSGEVMPSSLELFVLVGFVRGDLAGDAVVGGVLGC